MWQVLFERCNAIKYGFVEVWKKDKVEYFLCPKCDNILIFGEHICENIKAEKYLCLDCNLSFILIPEEE